MPAHNAATDWFISWGSSVFSLVVVDKKKGVTREVFTRTKSDSESERAQRFREIACSVSTSSTRVSTSAETRPKKHSQVFLHQPLILSNQPSFNYYCACCNRSGIICGTLLGQLDRQLTRRRKSLWRWVDARDGSGDTGYTVSPAGHVVMNK